MPDPLLKELERSGTPEQPRAEHEIDFLEIAMLVSRRRKVYGRVILSVLVLSTIVAFLLPLRYTSSAKILPPQNSQSSLQSMILSQMAGGSGSGAGSLIGGALNIKNPTDMYVAILKSRTIEDSVIDRFKLKDDYYRVKTYDEARKRLEQDVDVRVGKEGVIVLDVEMKDATFARDVARFYLDQMLEITENLATTEAGQRRQYFERELGKEKDRLADAEVELKKVQQSSGLIVPNEQARAIVEAMARLQGQIAAKEVQIGAMKNFAAPQNPELVQAQKELLELHAQLGKLQRTQGADSEGGILVPTGRIPQSALIRKYRDFKYHETIYEMLARQFELAKLDESKDYAALQVLDWPIIPDRKSSPKRSIIIGLSVLLAMFGAVTHALLTEMHRRKLQFPEYAARIHQLRTLWRRR
jgi:tyrosine-protein kinase Etk/Wzc